MRNARTSLSRRASTSREAESSSRRAAGSSATSAAQNNAISTQALSTRPGQVFARGVVVRNWARIRQIRGAERTRVRSLNQCSE